jgi:hypothetical protein
MGLPFFMLEFYEDMGCVLDAAVANALCTG